MAPITDSDGAHPDAEQEAADRRDDDGDGQREGHDQRVGQHEEDDGEHECVGDPGGERRRGGGSTSRRRSSARGRAAGTAPAPAAGSPRESAGATSGGSCRLSAWLRRSILACIPRSQSKCAHATVTDGLWRSAGPDRSRRSSPPAEMQPPRGESRMILAAAPHLRARARSRRSSRRDEDRPATARVRRESGSGAASASSAARTLAAPARPSATSASSAGWPAAGRKTRWEKTCRTIGQ